MENRSTDLSARLLATENLSVVRARTRTASFDIKSRVLTLPMWKDMTPEIEDMLVGHEVGHALYTDESYIEPLKEEKKLHSYLNVIEDVRIEKLMKRKYPGLRKRMNEGYKQLNDRDFFGVKQVSSFNDLLLIDKINLYFKAGFQCGVEFTPEEKPFVNRAERTETVEEVIALAKEIYAYSKEQLEERKKNAKQEHLEEDEDEDEIEEDYDFDLDGDEFSEEELEELKENRRAQNRSSESNTQDTATDAELESKTDKAFQSKLEDLADESTVYEYWELDKEFHKDTVIGFRRILNETQTTFADHGRYYDQSESEKQKRIQKIVDEFNSFKTESTRTVNYLVKEFEMKKSAELYKRAQVSKTGSLDMKRVWAYKLQDDLFKRVTVLPQGKNHGMVFLLDWSGSMDHVIQDTLKQVINLAMFCNRIQIPYRVLAFTSQYNDSGQIDYSEYRDFVRNKTTTYAGRNMMNNATTQFNLLEFFSSKMSVTEFNSMSKRLTEGTFHWNDGYSMGGTPLNEALSWVYHNLGDYIKQNNIEKTTLITLTDGEGATLYGLTGADYTERVRDDNKYVNQKNFIRDDFTKKTYQFGRSSGAQTETLLRMIKDRYNISSVGFYITRNHRGHLMSTLKSHYPEFKGDQYGTIDGWRKEFKDKGYASLMNTGRDELFLIPQTSTKIVEGEMDVKADANAKAIAKNFGKYLNVKKTSRILLNRFVSLVA